MLLAAGTARAELSVTPITWDVVGLDSNRPLTEGPELFPVAARVCASAATAGNVQVAMVWDDPDATWIDTRPGSLATLSFNPLGAGECADAYFEIQVTRGAGAFGQVRPYRIVAADLGDAGNVAQSPTPRQIFVERLVSQNRNTTEQIRWGQQADQSDWQVLGGGATLALVVGETYFIELATATATSYEQIESFITLSNTIFQILSVSTDYSTRNFNPPIPDPNPSLYGDGCQWDPDPDSPNYLSCQAAGKAGGTVTTVYEIRIISGGGEKVTLEALIYDFSGSSFHYNTDFVRSPGEIVTVAPSAPAFGKRFIPDTIGADGVSTVRFTISNPNPFAVSGYSFNDNLPTGMQVDAVPNASNTCGGALAASAGSSTISLAGGALEANSACTILVDVTVPFDAMASYPLMLTNSTDLLVGDPGDPEFTVNASDELTVTEFPPPPQVCTPNTLAAWDSFNSASSPDATADPELRNPAASGGPGLTFTTGSISGQSVWNAFAKTANQNLTQAFSADAYYQFSLDTAGLVDVDFALETFRQNGNAPGTLTLFWGTDAANLTQSVTLTPVPTRSNAAGFRNFRASGLDNLDDGTGGQDGITLFRVYAYNAANINQAVSILNVLISSGESCVDGDSMTAPNPPEVSKRFENPPGTEVTTAGIGQQLSLAFTITNPNLSDALTGLSLVDALPPGLEVVPGTFVNNCTGGTWSENPQGVLVLGDSSLDAGAVCTLSVAVTVTAVGGLTNLSDPVDANETLPGNSAQASLTVEAPPATPSIVKFFDPNPLFDPAGTTRLTFRITNNDPVLAISNVAFTDTLPAGLEFVSGSSTVTNCGTPIVDDGIMFPDTLEFSSGMIPPNSAPGVTTDNVCEVSVDVVLSDTSVTLPAFFDNTSGPVSHVFSGAVIEGNRAMATLLVDQPIPAVRLLKQVGLTIDPNGAWSDYTAVKVPADAFYKFTIENIGETALDSIALSDPTLNVSGCAWPASLPVADFSAPEAHIATCIVGPVTIASAGEFPNLATAAASSLAGDVQDSDNATLATAELTLAKTADRSLFSSAGETINYSFTVTNSGAAILSGPVAISDTLVPGASCPALSTIGNNDSFFDPGEVVVCSGSYTTTSTDVGNGQVQNTAVASAGGIESAPDSVTVPLAAPALTITKTQTTGPNPVTAAGQVLGYMVVVENTGTVNQTGVNASDTLPDGSNGVLAGPVESMTANGILEVGETWTWTIGYTVTQADLDAGGNLVNTAGVTTDQVPGPTSDTAITPVTQNPSLGTAKALTGNADEDGSGTVTAGDTLTYTVTVTNTGNTTLTNVAVGDSLITPASTSCASLAPGDQCVLTGTYTVTQADVDAGSIVNTGTGDSDQTDPPVSDELTVTTGQSPGLDTAKELTANADEDSSGTVTAGDTLMFTVTVTNTGNITLSNVVVSDSLITPASTSCASLAPGAQCVLTGTYTVTQADVDAGSIVNTGTGDSDQTDPPVSDELTVPAGQSPGLDTEKELTANADEDGSGTVTAGDTLTFTVTVTNTGNITLSNVVVSDSLITPASTSCASLAPGAQCVLTGTYQVQQSDVDAGEVMNIGTGTSDQTPPVDSPGVTVPVTGTLPPQQPVPVAVPLWHPVALWCAIFLLFTSGLFMARKAAWQRGR